VEMVITNPKVLWVILSSGYLYHRASVINAREEVIRELKLNEEEKDELRKFIGEKTQKIENIFWHGLDKYRNSLEDDGIKTVRINHGNDILDGKNVSDVKRDYHQALGKEAVFLGERLLGKALAKKNMAIPDYTSREKFINELAEGERETLISKTHKRAGYNKGIEDMEEENMPFEVFRNVVSEVVDHADLLEGIKIQSISKMKKDFKINPLSAVKIVTSIIGKIREKRWERKQGK
jgi:hypothetical protein